MIWTEKIRIGLSSGGIAFMLIWCLSCAINPVSGQHELMLLSDADEVKLGHQTDREIVEEYGTYSDSALNAYVQGIGDRLGGFSHRTQLDYQFKILDASVVNAFAVPGGYVYLTRGILAALNDEAELAGVIGHEIGHIAARHSAEQYSRAQLAQVGLGLGMIFSETIRSLSGFAQMGVGMLFLKFSRENERQADDLGVEYASRAGYDASRMAGFFETLERLNPVSDRTGLPDWFSTHPNPENRIAMVRARAKEWQQKLGTRMQQTNREEYLKKIDGLLYGDDPRKGYVEENVFYHPELRFQFPVPAGWKVNNTPSQVQMVSKGKEAFILFSMTSGASAGDAARSFVSKNNASLLRSDVVTVNGLPSYRILYDIRTQSGGLRALSYFIEMDRNIFVFHGVSSGALFQQQVSLFEETMRQFRAISDPKKIQVSPDRIRIRSANSSNTLEKTLISLGVPEGRRKETALLNGRHPEDVISAHTLLKVIVKG